MPGAQHIQIDSQMHIPEPLLIEGRFARRLSADEEKKFHEMDLPRNAPPRQPELLYSTP